MLTTSASGSPPTSHAKGTTELLIPLKSTTAVGPINRQQRRPGRHRTPSRVFKSRGIPSPKIEAPHIVDDRPKQAETPAIKNRVDLEGKHTGIMSGMQTTPLLSDCRGSSNDYTRSEPCQLVPAIAKIARHTTAPKQDSITKFHAGGPANAMQLSHPEPSQRFTDARTYTPIGTSSRLQAGSHLKVDKTVPRQSHNIQPQLSWTDVREELSQSIESPLFSEQRQARIRAIMPDLKSSTTLSDKDIPLPQPYNLAYPHPISAYASPGVNPAVLVASGYDKVLQDLLRTNPNLLKGGILAAAARDDILPPALTMVLSPGEGNGIPERLWTRFESIGGARLPVGIAAASPYARVEPATGDSTPRPPRFAAAEHAAWTTLGQLTPPQSQHKDYFPYGHRRSSASEIAAWINELSGQHTNDQTARDSAWFKTEICCVWEDTGLCKYGSSCQYAHGLHDLRIPSNIERLPTPPNDRSIASPGQLPDGCLPSYYHCKRSPISAPPHPEVRRASIAPKDLPTVDEYDVEIAPSYWKTEAFAPIGSERGTRVMHSARSSASYSPNRRMAERPLSTQASLSSISTASSEYSGRYHTYDISPTQTDPNPFDFLSTTSGTKAAPDWPHIIDSTSLNFSIGRSIWC